MDIEFDAAKDASNIAKHDISLRASAILLSGPHTVEVDDCFEYEEVRLIATGKIAGRLYICVHTIRGDAYRIISLRKANRRETNDHREG